MDVTFHVDDAYVNDVLDKLDALADEGQISGIQTCEQFMFAPWNYEKVLYDVEDKLSKANEDYPGILDDFSAEDVTLDVLEAMDNELNSNRNIDADGMTPYEKILDDRIHEYREKECVLNEARETMDMKQVSPLRQREILDRLKKQDRYALLRAQATDVEEDFADETGLMLCQAASSLSSTLGAAQQKALADQPAFFKGHSSQDIPNVQPGQPAFPLGVGQGRHQRARPILRRRLASFCQQHQGLERLVRWWSCVGTPTTNTSC